MQYRRLLGSAEALQKIINIIPSPVFVKDAAHRWVLVNDAAVEALCRPRSFLLGRTEHDVLPPAEAAAALASDEEVFRTGRTVECEETLTLPDGTKGVVLIRKTLLRIGAGGGAPFLVGVVADVTAYRRAAVENHFLSRHDVLTGLPNRVHFLERLREAVARGDEAVDKFAVMLIDLDGFKAVNDGYGHAAGDELLRVIAMRLRQSVRPTDMAARLGGDEFGMLLCGGASVHAVAPGVARQICAEVAKPVMLAHGQARVSASVGITYFSRAQLTPEELLRQADLAMYSVKRAGRHGHKLYEPALERAANRQLNADLHHARARQELRVVYQPLWNPPDGQLTGYEALLRWAHPHYGDIPPATFIPIAEQSGLIGEFGEFVLRAACAAATGWAPETRLAVNVSPVQLLDPEFPALVRTVLAETGLSPARLELEVTESQLVAGQEEALCALRALKAEGLHVALDDFGAGTASLDMLHRFGFDRMKIDRRFVAGLPDDERGAAIVGALIRLAHELGVSVTAEGVEHMEQAFSLVQLGCDEMQGYLFGHPEAPPSVL